MKVEVDTDAGTGYRPIVLVLTIEEACKLIRAIDCMVSQNPLLDTHKVSLGGLREGLALRPPTYIEREIVL